MNIPFKKYSGCGNDFILIDNRSLALFPFKEAIVQLCHRQHGIGADGLIFLENSTISDTSYRMRIFNADGSEAEMCGNGLRCLAHYIHSIKNTEKHFKIETLHHCLEVQLMDSFIQVEMAASLEISLKTLIFQQQEILMYCLNTGVPHVVHFVDNLENETLFSLAPFIRFHSEFHPNGTNVNFAKILSDDTIAVRTYERGVEQETLACGTGATAVAIAAAKAYSLVPPLKILTRSGDCLLINFQKQGSFIKHLTMAGPATKIFEGILDSKMFGFQLKSSAQIQ